MFVQYTLSTRSGPGIFQEYEDILFAFLCVYVFFNINISNDIFQMEKLLCFVYVIPLRYGFSIDSCT